MNTFDVIIIGGSYAGLSAAMALGRSMRKTLMIDGGEPCNRFTQHSHNFITHDGRPPGEIAALAREQVMKYDSLSFINGLATRAGMRGELFYVATADKDEFAARKLIFATGIRDLVPAIPGLAECWGKTVLHCPYCHGYEVRRARTGILSNGDAAFEYASLIANWTKDLTLFTNGKSTLTEAQTLKLAQRGIDIVEDEVASLQHSAGQLDRVIFTNGSSKPLDAIYTRPPFEQHCSIPATLGCEMTEDGYIKIDPMQKTTVPGIFACGDNVSRMRTVANAVAMGTAAGMVVNKELVTEDF